jgi:hypothetical protein
MILEGLENRDDGIRRTTAASDGFIDEFEVNWHGTVGADIANEPIANSQSGQQIDSGSSTKTVLRISFGFRIPDLVRISDPLRISHFFRVRDFGLRILYSLRGLALCG